MRDLILPWPRQISRPPHPTLEREREAARAPGDGEVCRVEIHLLYPVRFFSILGSNRGGQAQDVVNQDMQLDTFLVVLKDVCLF